MKKTGSSLESLGEFLSESLPESLPVPLGAPLVEPLSVLLLSESPSVLPLCETLSVLPISESLSVLPLREFREPMRPKTVLLVPYLFQVFPWIWLRSSPSEQMAQVFPLLQPSGE